MIRRYDTEQGVLIASERDDAPVAVYVAPTAEERGELLRRFGIDEHTVNSSLDPEEQARAEFDPERTAVILKRPQNFSSQDQFLFKVCSVGVFIADSHIVFVTAEDFPIFEGRQFQQVDGGMDILLKFVYRTVTHFYEHLKAMHAIISEIERITGVAMENKCLADVFAVEKSLWYYRDALASNATVIEQLRAHVAASAPGSYAPGLIDDLIIENRQCIGQADLYAATLASLMNTRASMVNNSLNELMKTLNKVVLAVMVPTFVVSLFSLPAAAPFQKHLYAFPMVLGAAALSLGVLLAVFRLKKW